MALMFNCLAWSMLDFSMNPASCPTNIGPAQRSKRVIAGVLMAVFSLGLAAAFLLLDVSPWIRITLAVPVWFAVLNWFQVRQKTCVYFAAIGKQDQGSGLAPVEDPEVDKQLRRQARMIYVWSTLVTLVVILAFVLLPW